MKFNQLGTKEERRIYSLFAKILIIRLITFAFMIFPLAWYRNERISADLFHSIWALCGGMICMGSIYVFIVEIRARVSVYLFADIRTNRIEDNPLLYVLNLFFGAIFIVIFGLFTYANLAALFS